MYVLFILKVIDLFKLYLSYCSIKLVNKKNQLPLTIDQTVIQVWAEMQTHNTHTHQKTI